MTTNEKEQRWLAGFIEKCKERYGKIKKAAFSCSDNPIIMGQESGPYPPKEHENAVERNFMNY